MKTKTVKKEYADLIVRKMPKGLGTDTAIGKSMVKDLQKLRLDTLNNLKTILYRR